MANEQGIRLAEVRIVPDDLARIGETVNALRAAHDYLFTTGGIGPTHDDITVDAIAAAFGVPVIVHPQARAILEDYYRDRPGGLNQARLRMARTPDGAELLPNPYSGAPGIKMEQCLYPRGRAEHRGEHARGVDRQARGRAAGGVGDGRSEGARKATSPTCCARPRRRIRESRSAAIRFSRTAATGPIS